MRSDRRSVAVALMIGSLVVLGAASCAQVTPAKSDAGTPGAGGRDGGLPPFPTGAGGGAGSAGTGTGGSGSTCTPVQCVQPTGRYCGHIGDGCNKTQECGACPADQVCDQGVCVAGAGCAPIGCQPATGGSYCGSVGNGCGKQMECGACTGGSTCTSGVCVQAGCVPLSCSFTNGQYCGSIGDGCGGTLTCGTCANGGACGGGGVAGVCGGAPGCVPITCAPTGGGRYCGRIGNGCGGALECGTCPDGMACGAGGTPGVCPGVATTVCQRLQCQIPTCTAPATTTISGTVYDPAGRTPLYNAMVYIPNAPLDPIPEGASCDKCSARLSGSPIATALSGTDGKFTLTNVPAGANIPLVIQVGKWRRQVTLPQVTGCVNNAITDVNMTRLPRTQSEGHIPRIGVTTGGSDALECFLRKVGIADSEFTLDSGAGRVNLYSGGESGGTLKGRGAISFAPALGGTTFPTAAPTLWGSVDKMLAYDILLFSCEGSQYPDYKLPYVANVKRYIDSGGRLFNSHLHFYWLAKGPAPLPMTGVGTSARTYDVGPKLSANPDAPFTAAVDQGFFKGMALAQWLVTVGASPALGQLPMYSSSQVIATAVNPPTTRWIYTQSANAVDYLSFNTPVEAVPDNQCGRVVLTDIHVKDALPPAGGHRDNSDPTQPFPTGCTSTTVSGQEKALEFLFFDLSACVQPDTTMPQPPVVPPPGAPSSPPPSVTVPPPVPPPPPPPPPPIIP